jgi:hypothetical protein
MTVLLTILGIVIVAGYGFSIYNAKILAPAFEAKKNKTKQLVRDILPAVRIHAINSPRDIHLTYLGSEYFVSGPHWKDDEDGGPKTCAFRVGPDRRVTCVWQRFHPDSKELNAQYFREALEFLKTETPNQAAQTTPGLRSSVSDL